MHHVLVIGGTGMLASVSLWLANSGFDVSVIGRSESKMRKLLERSDRIFPLYTDYGDDMHFEAQLQRAVTERGPFVKVVAWIHDNHGHILETVRKVNTTKGMWQLFHVLGSMDRLEDLYWKIDNDHKWNYCTYYRIQLGFVIEKDRSRWLTNQEIAEGVIRALESETDNIVIGTLTPWEARPSV